MGNLFGTLIGLIVGIPIALGIDRFKQEEQVGLKRQAEKEELITTLTNLSNPLKEELSHNHA